MDRAGFLKKIGMEQPRAVPAGQATGNVAAFPSGPRVGDSPAVKHRSALAALLAYRDALPALIDGLRQMPLDCDEPLEFLRREQITRVLERYVGGELSSTEVERWAETVEGRDDIGYEPEHEEQVGHALLELVSAEAGGSLTLERARCLIDILGTT